MLPDLKKFVGKRTDVDVEITQCKLRLQERPADAPQIYLKMGQLYASIEEKEAALQTLAEAAQCAAKADNGAVALAANTLIVQLDPHNKDALANLAMLQFQGGPSGFGEDYRKILHDSTHAAGTKESGTTLQDSENASQLAAKLTRAGRPKTERKRVDKAFENDRKALHDLIEGGGADAEAIPLESLKFESDRKTLISLIEDIELPGEHRPLSKPDLQPFPIPRPSSVEIPEETMPVIEPDAKQPEILCDLTEDHAPAIPIEETPLVQSPAADAASEALLSLLRRLPIFTMIPEVELRQYLQTFQPDIVLTRPFPKDAEEQALTFTLQVVLPPAAADHFSTPFSWSLGFSPVDAEAPPASIPATLELAGTLPAQTLDHPTAFLKELGIACKRRCFLPTLSQSPVFGQLPETLQVEIAAQCIVVRAPRGATIIAEGAPNDSLYLVHSGEVEMSATLAERGEVQVIQTEDPHIRLAKLRVGDLFGEDGFLTKELSTNMVTAFTEVYLLKLPAAMLTRLLKSFPKFGALLQQYHQQRAAATLKILQAALLGK